MSLANRSLANRIALVTGANRGLGLEIVRALASLGAQSVLAARDAGKASRAARALAGDGLAVEAVTMDVDDPVSVAAAMADVIGRHGRLDILVNNAGILLDGGAAAGASVLDMTREQLLASFTTNTLGAFHSMQAALPVMRARGYGRIVNISSRAGQLDELRPGFPSYRVSKTALNSLTRVTAAEFRHLDIKINAMCPGWLRTAMGGANAPLAAAEGTRTAVWLATLPADGPTGGFFREQKPLPW
jgi:NAD(P)-dependent dehydrogenase (short-subunit alcohol dehydrogenase family)